ncbi:MAG: 30S ribosomal protein S3, partial [Halobacteriales archaeon]
VQEVDEPDLNARIVADRLANALERGWYFRKAGHTTLERIMDSGALGAQIVMAGTVTGSRSRVEKFTAGYIKHNGEPADELVDEGQSVAVMKLGTIGVTVKIIPPDAELPDDFRIREDANLEGLVTDEADEVEAAEAPAAPTEAPEPEAAEPEVPVEEEPVEEAAPAEEVEAEAARLVAELDEAGGEE